MNRIKIFSLCVIVISLLISCEQYSDHQSDYLSNDITNDNKNSSEEEKEKVKRELENESSDEDLKVSEEYRDVDIHVDEDDF